MKGQLVIFPCESTGMEYNPKKLITIRAMSPKINKFVSPPRFEVITGFIFPKNMDIFSFVAFYQCNVHILAKFPTMSNILTAMPKNRGS